MSVEENGFYLTGARAAFAVSLIVLVTYGWKIAAHSVAQELTIQAHTAYIEEDKATKKEILLEIKELGKKVDRLSYSSSDAPSEKETRLGRNHQ